MGYEESSCTLGYMDNIGRAFGGDAEGTADRKEA